MAEIQGHCCIQPLERISNCFIMIFCVDKISLGVFVLCSAKIWNINESIWCYLDFEISKKVHPSGWNLKSSVLFRHEKGQNSLNVLMNEPCWTSRYRTARACLSWWQIPIQKRFQQVIVRKCIVLWILFRKSSEQLGCFREKKCEVDLWKVVR